MTIVDIIILTIIVGFAFWGMLRGLIREAFEAVGLTLGVVLAWQLAPLLGSKLPPQSLPLFLRIVAASVIILLVVFLAVMIAGWVTRKLIRHGPVKSADRLGGFLVGAIKGVLVVLALAIVLSITPIGFAIERKSNDSIALRWTMKVARPMGKRYQKALVSSVTKNIAKAIPAVTEAATKEALEVGSALESLSMADLPSNLSIDLNNLSPATEKLLNQILSDPSLSGLGIDMNLADLKAAGLGSIDLSLDELTPEARAKALKLISDIPKSGISIDEMEDILGDVVQPEVKRLLDR